MCRSRCPAPAPRGARGRPPAPPPVPAELRVLPGIQGIQARRRPSRRHLDEHPAPRPCLGDASRAAPGPIVPSQSAGGRGATVAAVWLVPASSQPQDRTAALQLRMLLLGWRAWEAGSCADQRGCAVPLSPPQTHSLSHRRAVPGRRKQFDLLLAEHKAKAREKEVKDKEHLLTPAREVLPNPPGSLQDSLPGSSGSSGLEPKVASPAKPRPPNSVLPR